MVRRIPETAPSSNTDTDAIHDNESGEMVLVAEKTAIVAADILLIEDSEDGHSKARVQMTNLPGGTPADDSITNAKLANMAEGTVKGKPLSTGTGDPVDLTPAQLRAIANVADGSTANATDAALRARASHTGDQPMSTISDAGALATADTVGTAEIEAGAVTNVEAADMAQDTIKGRITASTGDPENLTATQVRTVIGVEAGSTADQTDVEIKTAYENNADTNAFDDAAVSKLGGVELLADVTDAVNVETAGAVMESDATTAAMSFVVDEDDMVGDSDTVVPTQQSVKAYVDAAVVSSVQYQGGYNATTNTPDLSSPVAGAVNIGYMYTVTVAGTFFTIGLEIGDVLIAEIDDPAVEADWTVVNKDLDAVSIKSSYESNANTNEFNDAEKTKLSTVEARANHTGTQALTTIADQADLTILGNNIGGVGPPLALAKAAIQAIVNVADGSTANTGALADKDTVAAGDIDADAVTTVKILNDNVTTAKIPDEAVTLAKLGHITGPNVVLGKLTSGAGDPVVLSAANVKTINESNTDTNAFTDADESKLDGVELLAEVTSAAKVVAALDGASLPTATVATTDKVVIQDTDGSDAIKTVTAQSIADLGGGGGLGVYMTTVNSGARSLTTVVAEGTDPTYVKDSHAVAWKASTASPQNTENDVQNLAQGWLNSDWDNDFVWDDTDDMIQIKQAGTYEVGLTFTASVDKTVVVGDQYPGVGTGRAILYHAEDPGVPGEQDWNIAVGATVQNTVAVVPYPQNLVWMGHNNSASSAVVAGTVVDFDDVTHRYLYGEDFTVASGVVTVTFAGEYLIEAEITVEFNGGTRGWCTVGLYHEATLIPSSRGQTYNRSVQAAGDGTTASISANQTFAANDTIEVRCIGEGGAGQYAANGCRLKITRLPDYGTAEVQSDATATSLTVIKCAADDWIKVDADQADLKMVALQYLGNAVKLTITQIF